MQGEPPAKRQAIDPFGQYALQPQQQYVQPSLGVGLAPAQQQNYNGLLAQLTQGQRQVRGGGAGANLGLLRGAGWVVPAGLGHGDGVPLPAALAHRCGLQLGALHSPCAPCAAGC